MVLGGLTPWGMGLQLMSASENEIQRKCLLRIRKKCDVTVRYWQDGEWIVGQLKEYPEVFSEGKTLEELVSNLQDALRQLKASSENLKPVQRRRKYKLKHLELAA